MFDIHSWDPPFETLNGFLCGDTKLQHGPLVCPVVCSYFVASTWHFFHEHKGIPPSKHEALSRAPFYLGPLCLPFSHTSNGKQRSFWLLELGVCVCFFFQKSSWISILFPLGLQVLHISIEPWRCQFGLTRRPWCSRWAKGVSSTPTQLQWGAMLNAHCWHPRVLWFLLFQRSEHRYHRWT